MVIVAAGSRLWHVLVAHEHWSDPGVDRGLRAIPLHLPRRHGSQIRRAAGRASMEIDIVII